MGEARFEEPGVVRVGDERLTAPRVLVATGAAPVAPPVRGLADTPHLTSTDVLALRALPERLLVVGAGPIGLELGQALGRLGSRGTLTDVAPRLLEGKTDPEFATVGMTEEKARAAGHDVGVGASEFSGGKARAWGQERGLAKAVVDPSTGTILGAQVLAHHAADLIHPVVVAMRAGDRRPARRVPRAPHARRDRAGCRARRLRLLAGPSGNQSFRR